MQYDTIYSNIEIAEPVYDFVGCRLSSNFSMQSNRILAANLASDRIEIIPSI